ncbi:developmentally Regulated MAPK Interacting protein [Rutstroemia sp. NJR-2017a BVV2]|nr:developmentally Regulated MAPK Interacting protein [Rutstroemia sp. NJR-2017a BVV2]
MARYALALATLIAIAQAITITSPSKDGTWDLSKSQTITWTSVSTDPQTVDIYLAHMASNPPLNDKLFTNVDISAGSESISGLQLPTGEAYQINFVAPGKPEQILAQSQQFSVKGVAESASSTLAGFTGASSSSRSASSTASTSSSSSSSSSLVSSSSSLSSTASVSGSSALNSTGTASSTSGSSSGSASATGTTTTTATSSSGSSSVTGLVTSASAASGSAKASSSGKSSSSGNGAAATAVPMMGLLAGAMAVLL